LISFQVENLEDFQVKEVNLQKVILAKESHTFFKEAIKASQQKVMDFKLLFHYFYP